MTTPLTKMNVMCPNAPHEHRANSNKEKQEKLDKGFNPSLCIVCSPSKVVMPPFKCDAYEQTYTRYLSRESKIELMCCLNKKAEYWLPLELKWMILEYFKKPFYPLHIYNSITKSHFEKCPVCACRVVNFVDEHTCPHHVVLRKPKIN